jgi:hypothetical protein
LSDPQTPPVHPTPDDTQAESPIELAEFRAVANLLRQLPDPEPPEDLRLRVMAQVHAEQERPRVMRGLFGSRQPGIAAALAAGIAGWMFLVSPQGELPDTSPATLVPGAGNASEGAADIVTPVRRRPTPSRFSSAAAVPPAPQAFFASDQLMASQVAAPRTLPPLDRRLDRQIDQMLHQPDAFFRRLERIRENDRYLARLAERSARRGDSAAVALQVRGTQHPLAPKIAEQFLRASLAHSLSAPRSTAPHPAQQPANSPRRPGAVYAH